MTEPLDDVSPQVRALAAWVAGRPADAALLLDFDGTLSPIVGHHTLARPSPGVVGWLEGLSRVLGSLVVVSGRPLSFLTTHLGPKVDLVGLYGLEWRLGGVRGEIAGGARWREVVERASRAASVDLAEAIAAGVDVESKGLSLTIHFRQRPQAEAAIRRFAERTALETGLELRSAKRSVELHPAVERDKGTVVHELAAAFPAVAFIGDDLGDLPAFAALDDLARVGTETRKVAVASQEAPRALLDAADVVLPSQADVADLLRRLAAALPAVP